MPPTKLVRLIDQHHILPPFFFKHFGEMSTTVKNTSGPSIVMDTSDEQCNIFPQDFPTDILLQVGESSFPLHKIMLLAKSNYLRRLILESEEPDLKVIDLSNFPGGAKIFDKVVKFCYGVSFEMTQNNIAALHCAAEYLEMTDEYCDGNLASRTYAFLNPAALSSLLGAITVLNSCEDLLPIADELNIVHQCVEAISAKASNEAKFPSCSPPNWWAEELSNIHITFFPKIIDSMRSQGVKEPTIAEAITIYAKRSLPGLVTSIIAPITNDPISRNKKREILASVVALMPTGTQKTFFSINFLCCFLRTAIFVESDEECKKQLENQISGVLEHVTVDDLLTLSYTFDGEKLGDMESVRRIVTRFMEIEKEKTVAVFTSGEFQVPSRAMLKVVKTVDAFLCEIANTAELTISKFNEIANLVPKIARLVHDDLYHAIDIYFQSHPNLDEIEREKVCSTMDPLKLSAEAREHASLNNKFPLQLIWHTLYYDQLHVRSGPNAPSAQSMRLQVHSDVLLAKENENLRSELLRMKMYVSDLEKKKVGTSSTSKMKKHTFFSSVSKTLGKFNPFKKGSKDTLNIVDGIDRTKPRRRRFSMS
uniref:root phototropism protein 2-like n=1 Tax=Erigeron canadensis TaxID=72917 RepID=UPI001CB929FB|nr:root phototropism protein 2-like [Erigeron canadensis]